MDILEINNEELSKAMCKAIREQKDIDDELKIFFLKILQNDVLVQDIIKSIIFKNGKIIGSFIFAFVLAVIGGGCLSFLFR